MKIMLCVHISRKTLRDLRGLDKTMFWKVSICIFNDVVLWLAKTALISVWHRFGLSILRQSSTQFQLLEHCIIILDSSPIACSRNSCLVYGYRKTMLGQRRCKHSLLLPLSYHLWSGSAVQYRTWHETSNSKPTKNQYPIGYGTRTARDRPSRHSINLRMHTWRLRSPGRQTQIGCEERLRIKFKRLIKVTVTVYSWMCCTVRSILVIGYSALHHN